MSDVDYNNIDRRPVPFNVKKIVQTMKLTDMQCTCDINDITDIRCICDSNYGNYGNDGNDINDVLTKSATKC